MDEKVKTKAYQIIEYLRVNGFLSFDTTDREASALVTAYLNHPEIAEELEAYAEANHFWFLSRNQVLILMPLLKPRNKLALTAARTFESLKHTNAFSKKMTKLQVSQRLELARYCALTLTKQLLDDNHVLTTGNFQDHPVFYQDWVKKIDDSLTKAVDRETDASEFTYQDLLDTWQQLQPETKDNHPKDVDNRHYFLINVVLTKLFLDHRLVRYLKDDDEIQSTPNLPAFIEYLNSDDAQPLVDEFLEGKLKEEVNNAEVE